MLTQQQYTTMLNLQAGLNERIDAHWQEARYPFLRAVVMEGVEAIDHVGWKWWKAHTRDNEQLQMELVDIWHFLLSAVLQDTFGDSEQAASLLRDDAQRNDGFVHFDGDRYVFRHLDEVARYELLIGLAAARRFSTALFVTLMDDAGLSWDSLYRQYVGKNTLNLFRQHCGYKSGGYHKIWGGVEDNVHLSQIVDALDSSLPGFEERVYEQLAIRYAAYLHNAEREA